MESSRRFLTYAVAPATVGAILILHFLLPPWANFNLLILFVGAVVACTLFGGAGPGILATGLSVIAAIGFPKQVPLSHGPVWQEIAIFGAVCAAVVWLGTRRSRSDERFRQLADSMPQLVWTARADGTVEYYNRRHREFAGFNETRKGHWEWTPGLHPDDQARTVEAWNNAWRTGTLYEVEHRVRMVDGQYRWQLSRAVPSRDKRGRITCWYGTATDIHEQKLVQEALRESEERFRTLADNMAQFAWMADTSGAIFWFNRRWYDYTGATFEEVRGFGWRKIHHPDHLDRAAAKFFDTLKQGQPWQDIFPLRSKDGEYRWFLSQAVPIRDDQGQVLHWFGTNTDITEQREAEEALRRSEAILAQAGEMAHFGAWEKQFNREDDTDEGYLHWSDEVYRIFGYEPQGVEVTEALFVKHVHPDDRQRVREAVRQAVADRLPYSIEHRVIRNDGAERIVSEHAQVEYDEMGRAARMLGAVQDITERKHAENAVESQRATLMTLLENMPSGVTMFAGSPLKPVLSNRLAKEILTREPPAEIASEDLASHFRAYVAGTNQPYPPERMPVVRAMAGETCSVDDMEVERTDGSRVRLEVYGAPVHDYEGHISAAVTIFQDITERKRIEEALRESEDRFREAFANAPIGMVLVVPEGRFLQVNRAFCGIVGYEEHELLSPSMNFRLITHPEDVPNNLEEYRRLLAGEISVFVLEKRYFRKDGEIVWVRVSASLRHDAQASSPHIIGIVEDITRRKEVEAQLINLNRTLEDRVEERTRELLLSQEALRQSERLSAIGQVATTLGHEARNSVQTTLAALDLLARRLQDQPKLLDIIEKARKSQTDMQRLYEQVRSYAAPTVLQRSEVPLDTVWREAWDELDALRHGRNARLIESLDDSGMNCSVDPFHIKRVFRNLMENALAARTEDPFELHISCRTWQLDGRPALRVTIKDNGPGVDEATAQRLFEPFFTTKSKGTGLGMAIVKRIVEEHGGRVALGSYTGSGFEVIIDLPRTQQDSD